MFLAVYIVLAVYNYSIKSQWVFDNLISIGFLTIAFFLAKWLKIKKTGFLLVTAAFGLVAALAWNGAVQNIFISIFGTAEGILPSILYAVIVTVLAVLVTLQMGKMSHLADGNKKKK